MKNPFKKTVITPEPFTYASYRSAPRPIAKPTRRWKLHRGALVMVAVLVIALGTASALRDDDPKPTPAVKKPAVTKVTPKTAAAPVVTAPVVPATTPCTGNSLEKLIAVNLSQKHLWACQGETVAYDAPIISGIAAYPETVTPPGTYKIYAKQVNQTLTGSDSAGPWNRPVSYWMPFLSNQYGIYGFHDATWRADSEFGTVDPSSDKGSHGCVELTLAAQTWIYNWAPVGTTLTIT